MINGIYGSGGPYAYCDYWASVLGLRSMIDPRALESGRIDLNLFHHALDRPAARLLSWRIYVLATLLGPGAIIYQRATRLRRRIQSRTERLRQRMLKNRLAPYALQLKRAGRGRVRVDGVGDHWNGPLIDPSTVRVVVSTLFPTYKLLIATLITLAYTATAMPILTHLEVPFLHTQTFVILSYAALTILLYVLLGDFWTALLGPLPFLVARKLLIFSAGVDVFYLGLIGIGVLVYLIEFFFIPRPLPPVVFLYVNETGHPLQTYQTEQAPYWLEGKAYWVWRFVILAPAELTKFWERDWERVEIWVRADEGPQCGEIEWIVSDFHYRELWFRPQRWMGEKRWRRLCDQLARWRESGRGRRHWLLEIDLDLLFHSPSLRWADLGRGAGPRPRSAPKRMWKSIGSRKPRDFPPHYWGRLSELELEGFVLLRDVPEHLRRMSSWSVLRLPWSYWRYPLGVKSAVRHYLYDPSRPQAESARSSVDFQIKSPPPRQPGIGAAKEDAG
ncbi:MAG: hypothetical protein GF355_12605 [Candidatus Eisenbacteria bacterium]|nr:hypothetical protein [Candidatus Eisenbacteria bacterium]